MSSKKPRKKTSTSYAKHLQEFINQYIDETGNQTIDMRHVAAWALRKGLWEPQPEDNIKRLARDLSRAARQDYIEDDDSQPVRRLHAFKIKQGDVQLTFWVTIEDASPAQMRNASQWRRNGILADCIQVDRDLRHYNKHFNPGDPISVELNFGKDVEEKRQPGEYKDSPPPDGDE
jgi:hypothetical protein